MITEGPQKGLVVRHWLELPNSGTWSLRILFNLDGGELIAKLWLTEKAWGIARKSLKALGFDPDARNIEELHKNGTLLAGVTAMCDVQSKVWKGKSKMEIAWINEIPKAPTQNIIDKINKGLRECKKKEEAPAAKAPPSVASAGVDPKAPPDPGPEYLPPKDGTFEPDAPTGKPGEEVESDLPF